jgi:uncharacterized protein (DUF58 family)
MYLRVSAISGRLNRQARQVHFPFRWKRQSYGLRPTRYGIIFLLMLIALLIGSINHNNNFGYLLTFLLGGIVFVSLAHSFFNLRNISITPVPTKPVFAGGRAEISFLLQATTPLKQGIKGRLEQFSSEPVELVDGVSTPIKISVPTFERGMLHRSSVSLATDFPLGLIEIQVALPVAISCLVYPAPVAGPLITDTVGAEEDAEAAAGSAGETEFSEISPYRLGDDIRRLHWKSLAAGKDLHTVAYDESPAGGTMFSLSSVPGENIETKLGRLCHMILTAESRGMKYGLVLDDSVIPRSSGAAHRNTCLKALALYR